MSLRTLRGARIVPEHPSRTQESPAPARFGGQGASLPPVQKNVPTERFQVVNPPRSPQSRNLLPGNDMRVPYRRARAAEARPRYRRRPARSTSTRISAPGRRRADPTAADGRNGQGRSRGEHDGAAQAAPRTSSNRTVCTVAEPVAKAVAFASVVSAMLASASAVKNP